MQHEEAEARLLGILAQYRDAFLAVSERLRSSDFENPVYGLAYEELTDLYFSGEQVEFSELLTHVAGKAGRPVSEDLIRAYEEGVSSASLDWALGKVLDASRRRYLRQHLSDISRKVETEEDPQVLFDKLLQIATEGRAVVGQVYDGRALADRIKARQERRVHAEDTIEGYRTGWKTVDAHLGGLVPRRMTIISGPSGHGKTSLVANWMANICVMNGIPGLFASLEMSADDMEDRLIAILSGATLHAVKMGSRSQSIFEATQDLEKSPLHLTDNHPRDIHDVAFLAERYARTHKIKVFALDYVGELVRDSIKQREERDERFARWTKILRDTAKRLDLHVILVAQVNWEGALAESKKMGHIADHHLHFWREGNQHILECRKNRYGPVDYKYAMQFDRQTQRMTELGIMRHVDKED